MSTQCRLCKFVQAQYWYSNAIFFYIQKVIKDTFSLQDVPKEALYFGMAGVIPYLVTSLDTAYLAWEINNAATKGSGVLISGQSAELMLHMIEPIQVGYGAVVSAAGQPCEHVEY